MAATLVHGSLGGVVNSFAVFRGMPLDTFLGFVMLPETANIVLAT